MINLLRRDQVMIYYQMNFLGVEQRMWKWNVFLVTVLAYGETAELFHLASFSLI